MSLVDEVGLAPLADDLVRVEERLTESVQADDRFLGEVAGHLLGAGGKRLRPMLALCAGYAATGADVSASADIVTGAAAVELVHLGSLYHDDVIDEAETRRGVPSVNARWSNIVAILAGDYLLAAASSLAASLGADVAGLLATTIGELCRGQVLELQHLFDVERSEESYLSSIEGKTASLMATASRIGGMVTSVSADTLDALTQFGHHLGMCFQVVDDVLDVTQTEAELGKPAGNDVHEGVYTLPVIYALQSSGDLKGVLGRKVQWPEVAHAVDLIATPEVVDASMAVARTHASKASEALAGATELDLRVCERLGTLVDGLVRRSSTPLPSSRELFQRRVDAWLAADLDAYMVCWAPDMVIELPSGVIEGRERYRKLVAAGFAWAKPVSFEVHYLAFTDDDVALADWTIQARRREDDALVEWRGLSVCKFRGAEIAWWREHHLTPPAPMRR